VEEPPLLTAGRAARASSVVIPAATLAENAPSPTSSLLAEDADAIRAGLFSGRA